MYFLPRNNKLYSFLVTVKPLYRFFLIIVFLGMLTSFWYFFLYGPLCARCIEYRNDIIQLHEKVRLLDQSKVCCVQLENSLQDLRQSLHVFKYDGVAGKSFQEVMLFVAKQAHENNVFLSSCSEEQEVDKEWYTKTIMHMSIIGELSYILSFFKTIKDQVVTLVPEDIYMIHSGGTTFTVRSSLAYLSLK